uniref:Ferritin n=1 Tax=Culicoides sonorensis TaxID=179676 RepID=Q5QBK7_CULSO|nr:ferritin light chain-like [Culicoides sonorensis]
MKFLIFTVALLSISAARADQKYCLAKEGLDSPLDERIECSSSRVGGFVKHNDALSQKLTNYAWDQIVASYDHLLLSVNFDTYTKDRPGFEKLYRGLSDKAWEKAVEVLKYVAKRGGKPDVTSIQTQLSDGNVIEASVSELKSLAEAVKLEKSLANHALKLHSAVQNHHHDTEKDLDAGVAHFVEEELIEYQTESVRTLVGYHNDFKTILKGQAVCTTDKNTQLACFLFDDYLQKQG